MCSVLGLRTRMACPNYEVVWDGKNHLLLQPGSNLGKMPIRPYTLGAQPASFKPDDTKEYAIDKRRMKRIQHTTSEGQKRGAPLYLTYGTLSFLVHWYEGPSTPLREHPEF